MAIEDTRAALGECADHLEFVGEQCAGPFHEEVEKGVGCLSRAHVALQVAFEELDNADEIFRGLQRSSMEVNGRIKRAAQIAGQLAAGSSNTLIAEVLPKNTSDMAKFTKWLTDAIFTTANDVAIVYRNRVRPMAEDLEKRKEGWQLEALENNGGLMHRHSAEVREYLENNL